MTEDPTAFGASPDPSSRPPAQAPPDTGGTAGDSAGGAPGEAAGDPAGGPATDTVPPAAAPRRLERAGEGRLVTGVCGGIGRYTRVDPVVIRVGFAVLVLATFGVGILLYVAAYLLMAEEGGSGIVENVIKRRLDGDTVLTLLGGLLGVGVVLSVAGAGLSPDVLVVASLFAVVLLVAHARGVDLLAALRAVPDRLQRRSGPQGFPAGAPAHAPAGGAGAETGLAPQPQAYASDTIAEPSTTPTAPPETAPSTTPTTQPITRSITEPSTGRPAGEPAAASAFAASTAAAGSAASTDATEPAAAAAAAAGHGYPPRDQMVDLARLPRARAQARAKSGLDGAAVGAVRRSVFTPLTLFALLIALAAMVPVAAPYPPAHAVQIVLAGGLGVVALALFGGGWFGQGRGLVAVGTVLSLGLLTTSVATELPSRGGRVGDAEWNPVEVGEIAPSYRVLAGNGRLDLTGLKLSAGQRVTVSAEVTMGEFRVIVPRAARVEVHAHAGMGDIIVDDRLNGGVRVDVDRVLPPEGKPTARTPTFVLNIRAGMGNLEVQRVDPSELPERLERPQRPERPEQPERPERPEQPEQPARPEIPVIPERGSV